MNTRAEREAMCHALYEGAGIFALLGIEAPVLDEVECTQRWVIGPEHTGITRTMHGGMVVVLADSLSAFVVMMSMGAGMFTTTDLTVQYLRPMVGAVVAKGRLVKGGRRFATVVVEVSEEGKEIGALVVMKLLLR
ncbi:MAG: PaaI family thioesterase [bacterium]